jgi:hypothetical protein
MVPSGYKEDTVYSVVPTDGSGDLSFTRASNGTRINSAGLVEVVAWNLLQYSEQIDNGVWTKFSPTSVTADTTTAPNGTATADTISTSATAVIRQSVTLNANETYTYSIYVKKISYDFFGFQNLVNGSGIKSSFDLSNGTVTSQGSGHSASIESVGNGWYRCIITFNCGSSSSNIFDLATEGTSATLRTFYAWGAQSNIGSTAKPYFPTTDRLNVPRLTYQNGGGGCPSLLLEKQSTNLQTWSEQHDNAAWIKLNLTIIANQATSPSGSQDADLVHPSTGVTNDQNYNSQTKFGLTIGASYTQSVFLKSAGFTWAIVDNMDGGAGVWFNLVTGTIGTITAGCTAKIENYGNGWYRCSVTSAPSGTTGYGDYRLANADNNDTVTASGTSGIYAWGFQLEASSYPTSYISTTSASATRVADACFKTGIGSLFGANSGTIYFQTTYYPETNIGGGERFVYAQEDTSAGFIRLWQDLVGGTQQFRMLVNDGGTQQVNASVNVSTFLSTTQPSVIKWAMAYEANRFVTYINGVQRMIDTSGTAPTISEINFNNTFQTLMPLAQALVFPTALSDAELASLTTI